MDTEVLVVGAGPTGLVLALWLARLGIQVRIIDKTAGPGSTSRALAVQARTLEFYRQLGFADELVEAGLVFAAENTSPASSWSKRGWCSPRRTSGPEAGERRPSSSAGSARGRAPFPTGSSTRRTSTSASSSSGSKSWTCPSRE